ncbi:MAG: hypothetical protein HYT70_03810 [Candidatus Aenigmarchaeota archaeon]|nr:hypothetical protein [Candidatus Aenigmarchaeota archaeon]
MHLAERKFAFLFVGIATLVFTSIVIAATITTTLTPTSFVQGVDTEFLLTVSNDAGASINQVELVLPQRDGQPLFIVRQITAPAEWTFESSYVPTAPSPFRIAWSTEGTGLAQGKSLTFKVVLSSNEQGTFPFSWKTFNTQGDVNSGEMQVKSVQQAFSGLKVTAPNSAVAGNAFDLTVTAVDASGSTKKDYAGTASFSSSDSLGILPSSYAFQASDGGTKTFKVRLKTAGQQDVTVTADGASQKVNVNVTHAEAAYIDLMLNSTAVNPNGYVSLSVTSYDIYNNSWDVTGNSTFSIDSEAKGMFSNETYRSEVEGLWTVKASYSVGSKSYLDGETLHVTSAGVPQPEEPKPEAPVQASAEIAADELIQVTVNTTKAFTINVKNTGDVDLSNVSIVFSGFPETLMNVTPSIVNIEKGKTQKFTASVHVNEKLDPARVDFLVLSKELSSNVFSVQKTITLNFTDVEVPGGTTGGFTLNRNLTYLGTAIIVAVALIILFWFLFLREEPKKKKVES